MSIAPDQDIDVDAVVAALSVTPGQRAPDLAATLQVDRRSLNQLLHSRIDLFEKDPDGHSWSNRASTRVLDEDRTPGPFGPAVELIPRGQILLTVPSTDPCRRVLDIILDRDISAVPVTNESGRIIGVATAESILEHFRALSNGKLPLAKAIDAPIRHLLESPRFIAPDTFIDLQIDWQDIQHVIVGTPDQPIGILTLSDVWKVLHRFAEAFVLIHEIEVGLRRIIDRTAAGTGSSIASLLSAMHIQDGQARPQSLKALTFSQYIHLMYSQLGRPLFEPVLGSRDVLRPMFDEVNEIRNAVMHFHDHRVPEASLAKLRRFRITVRG